MWFFVCCVSTLSVWGLFTSHHRWTYPNLGNTQTAKFSPSLNWQFSCIILHLPNKNIWIHGRKVVLEVQGLELATVTLLYNNNNRNCSLQEVLGHLFVFFLCQHGGGVFSPSKKLLVMLGFFLKTRTMPLTYKWGWFTCRILSFMSSFLLFFGFIKKWFLELTMLCHEYVFIRPLLLLILGTTSAVVSVRLFQFYYSVFKSEN